MTAALEDEIVLKLLHTADWHLGRRFSAFEEEAERKLMRARLDVLDRILLAAERHAVHAVLCAGDLFDEPNPSRTWWEQVAERFKRCSWRDRPVFLLPGNHDPYLADAVWANAQFRSSLPSFVHIVDRTDFEFTLANGAVLYAVPCMSKAGQRDPTEQIPERAPGDERVRIGMVHGSTFDAKDYQTNFPIHVDAAVKRGLDYLAIGDTHGFRLVPPERTCPPTVYPGAPEATAFDEKDPGSIAVVLINGQRRAQVRKERVAHWTWEEQSVGSIEELRQVARRTDLGNRVLRLHVSACLSASEYDEAELLLAELQGTEATHGRVGVLDLHREQMTLDTLSFDAYCTELPDVLKAVVRQLRTAAEDPQRAPAAQRALFHLYRTSRNVS
jgi:DNA repair exonuclease SbcCD nuclease subunit